MSKNLTWCLVRNLLKQNTYPFVRQFPQQIVKRFEHAERVSAPLQTENKSSIDYCEVKTYQQFLEESQIGEKHSVRVLMNLLDIRRETAIKFTKEWKILNHLTKPKLLKNYQLLRSAGAFRSTIRHNIQALADKPENIQSKIKSLKKIKLEFNYGIPLFQLTAVQLMLFAHTTVKDRVLIPDYNNRVEYLADRFNCHVSTICTILCTHPPILMVNLEKIIEITDFLLDEVGMKPEYILGDLVIYGYSLENIKDRLYRARRAGMEEIKPWLIRCPISHIERWEQKKQNWDNLVGPDTTLEEHISNIMKCDVEFAASLLYRSPYIKSLCILKLTNILKFLASVGYSIHEVYRAPGILHRLESAIRHKYDSWVEAGLGHPPISLMNISEKRFEQKLQEALARKAAYGGV
ncbi:transcription termination factor, mitochondrial [Diachasma alloeum]|uniref:transcription termination factor, mitochondrial n=1 Tax=Diachasma alloeum TaxID=454923 RepID=UPI0007381776|nr:transcription termination factor, mitochondrial [Diachasma alloeum]